MAVPLLVPGISAAIHAFRVMAVPGLVPGISAAIHVFAGFPQKTRWYPPLKVSAYASPRALPVVPPVPSA